MSAGKPLRRAADALVRRSGPTPAPSRRVWIIDIVIAVLLTSYGLIYAGNALPPIGEHLVGADPSFYRMILVRMVRTDILTVLSCLPLAARRRFPLASFLIVLAATMTMHGNAASRIVLLASLIGAYSAARYSPYRIPTRLSLLLAATLLGRYFSTALPDILSTALTSFAILIPTVLAAEAIRTGKVRTEESRQRIHAMEGEQQENTRRAVEHERARIARELHDVVTHNVSVMVVQAGAARKIMATAPDQAREALLAVEASGRSAMAELRQVMGLLTPTNETGDGADDPTGLAPQPGLDQLPGLVDRVRGTGIPVEFTVTGEHRPLPAGVDLAAYRVVQEALTNTVKHAVGASATVTVHYGFDELRVTVADAGGQTSAVAGTGNGRGLLGLRERLAVYRGSLSTGRQPGGGYRVAAVIPLEDR